MANNQSKNKLVVPGAQAAIDNMKAEIANENVLNCRNSTY